MKKRLVASGVHLGLSVAVAALAGLLVFGLWYPYPYREISGGRELFTLLVSVDVVVGPMITLAIFNTAKPRRELVQDLTLVGLLQLAALAYGLWTVAVARPVHLVWELDRFRVVHAIDVPAELLGREPADVVALPLTGPSLLSIRPFRGEQERMDATMAALQGVAIGARPDFWQSYEAGRADVLQRARPVAQLKARFPAEAARIDAVLAGAGKDAAASVWAPMVGRKSFWTVFLDARSGQVVGFLPLDSF